MRILTCTLALIFLAFGSYAQKTSKEEKALKKEWKKKMKKMDPLEFKDIVESSEKNKREISNLQNENEELQRELSDKNSELKDAQDDLTRLKGELAAAKSQPKPKKVDSPFAIGDPNDGVVFKVQIGAFRNKDLSKFLNNHPNFSGEEEDGMRKYTLGIFREYYEADEFKKYLRAMGVADAWIVSYKDGTRVPLKDVLEGVI